MKVRFKGERAVTLVSQPAGVTIQVKPGEVIEVDGGFEYLRGEPRFEVLEDAPPKEAPVEKAEKTKK